MLAFVCVYLSNTDVGSRSSIGSVTLPKSDAQTELFVALQGLLSIQQSRLLQSTCVPDYESAADHLQWLTSTKAFRSWMSIARGEVVCSRWLWYPGVASNDFVTSFGRYFQGPRHEVLYFDFSTCLEYPIETSRVLAKYLRHIPIDILVVLLSLAAQAFGVKALKDDEERANILKQMTEWSIRASSDDNMAEAALKSLRKLLRIALNFRSRRSIVGLLHNAGSIGAESLEMVRNLVQDVMDTQRTPEDTQVRAFFTCRPDYEIDVALKGIAKVDESSEYQGKHISCHLPELTLIRQIALSH